jgi:hypothetical protein
MRQSAVVLALLSVFAALYALAHADRSRWGERADAGFAPPSDLRIDGDLVYARYGNRLLRLDLYRPARMTRNSIPAVVVIRGGGFQQRVCVHRGTSCASGLRRRVHSIPDVSETHSGGPEVISSSARLAWLR